MALRARPFGRLAFSWYLHHYHGTLCGTPPEWVALTYQRSDPRSPDLDLRSAQLDAQKLYSSHILKERLSIGWKWTSSTPSTGSI